MELHPTYLTNLTDYVLSYVKTNSTNPTHNLTVKITQLVDDELTLNASIKLTNFTLTLSTEIALPYTNILNKLNDFSASILRFQNFVHEHKPRLTF